MVEFTSKKILIVHLISKLSNNYVRVLLYLLVSKYNQNINFNFIEKKKILTNRKEQNQIVNKFTSMNAVKQIYIQVPNKNYCNNFFCNQPKFLSLSQFIILNLTRDIKFFTLRVYYSDC